MGDRGVNRSAAHGVLLARRARCMRRTEDTMLRRLVLAVCLLTMPLAASTLASQGPGARTGSASAVQQLAASLIIAGLGAFLVVGLVIMLLEIASRR
jgi:hypothetical protein